MLHVTVGCQTPYCMGCQTSSSTVFSAYRILLLELFHTRQSLSTLLLSFMNSIGSRLGCELDLTLRLLV